MITFTTGNLLEADAEALVNTVNTVGVMGKGIALMFKEAFPDNFKAYEAACKSKVLVVGSVFTFERRGLLGPRWIINFPTKAHWRNPSKIEWIRDGLIALKTQVSDLGISSVAIPPLGSGNGGLEWSEVRELIAASLKDVKANVIVYEPVVAYQNVQKREGTQKLTPTRAVIADLVRQYSILGIDCTLLEVQKLAYFAERFASGLELSNMDLQFSANKYGPYSEKLRHLLNGLDGSYLHCTKRLPDAAPFDLIRFDDAKKDRVSAYLTAPEAKPYRPVLEKTSALIDGFESPLGMELLSTVDWLVARSNIEPTRSAIKHALRSWPGGADAAERKLRLFEDRIVDIALVALTEAGLTTKAA